MDGLSKKLTEKDVTEALSQRKELLECYRQRLAMLSKEYDRLRQAGPEPRQAPQR